MKKQLLYIFLIVCSSTIYAQSDALWQKVSTASVLRKSTAAVNSEKLYYKLNSDFLTSKLSAVNNSTEKTVTEITIPNTAGVLERFTVWESSNFDPELQAKYPDIRSYQGQGVDDKTAKIYFSTAPIGTKTMVFRLDKPSEYIEQNPDDKSEYVLFSSNDNTSKMRLECKTADLVLENNSTSKTAKISSSAKTLKTLRLALSCTAEYTAYFGGTKAGALAGMNATLSRVNGLFDRDLSVKLVLIANNNDIIYTNATTDPYSEPSVGNDETNPTWGKEVQATLTSVIGNANYDIGHLFGGSGGGGNAGCIGCVCVNPASSGAVGKGSAYTSPADAVPEGDNFDIDFVAHEFGHQLGAFHTFSHTLEGNGSSYEPGSGSTIMGYAGVTNGYNVQNKSDDYFSYPSIIQIQNNLATKSCPVSTAITNNPPVINAGPDYTIPISTPFILTGTGSDAEGNTITYTWEQFDNATSTSGANSTTYPTKPNGPMFRSIAPTTSPVRYMPSLSSVLQNQLTTTWESVSSIAKTMNFTLTGRDNAPLGTAQTFTDAMVVTVSATAGPFAVTYPSSNVGWEKGSTQTITWSVNNTNTLQGSAAVNIKLSTDGGLTFPIVLASNTPNDGSEAILVPTDVVTSTNCRILIEPTANIYYTINSKAFSIGYTVATTCNTYSFGSSFSIPYSSGYTTRTVTVPAATGTVSDVNVSLSLTHDRLSDVQIEIVSPQGTTVRLYNKACSNSSTLALQLDDDGTVIDCSKVSTQIVVPVDLLSAFNGQNPQGTWTFRVRDNVVGSFGTINAASVDICTTSYTLGTPDFDRMNFVLYPNPNKGNFTIQFQSESTTGVKVLVHDVLGKIVYDKTFENTGDFNQNIQLANASSGIYLVTVIDGNKKTVKKIVIN
ncbi:zinc-dependent metalloprotease [Flavobacterium reichenbachii]|uniref:Propanediol utilization protein n=1 Tax=Flavobacterium reichenbachii TaxID=362418 RepID=A0A085ZJV0_9FLAO|nr:zinc-dependent metalloprotease family protein [Flavobacterium reichenbachii]KFF04714.1 propanediol utilization protein [Flavobacterium reichenbachii]OXB10383.1 T9SS C-terminal target domain-containing protein [Flavobacterium reichenbachii]